MVVTGMMAIVCVHLQHLEGQEGLSLCVSKVVPVKLRHLTKWQLSIVVHPHNGLSSKNRVISRFRP